MGRLSVILILLSLFVYALYVMRTLIDAVIVSALFAYIASPLTDWIPFTNQQTVLVKFPRFIAFNENRMNLFKPAAFMQNGFHGFQSQPDLFPLIYFGKAVAIVVGNPAPVNSPGCGKLSGEQRVNDPILLTVSPPDAKDGIDRYNLEIGRAHV